MCMMVQHISDDEMIIENLLDSVTKANIALEGFQLLSLLKPCGHTGFMELHTKTGKKKEGQMGLQDFFAVKKIRGRSKLTKTKGMMFFYLCCMQPDHVVFPEFTEKLLALPSNAGLRQS